MEEILRLLEPYEKWMKQCMFSIFSQVVIAGLLKHQQYDVRYDLQKPPNSITRLWTAAATPPRFVGSLADTVLVVGLGLARRCLMGFDGDPKPGEKSSSNGIISAGKNIEKYRFQKHNASKITF